MSNENLNVSIGDQLANLTAIFGANCFIMIHSEIMPDGKTIQFKIMKCISEPQYLTEAASGQNSSSHDDEE